MIPTKTYGQVAYEAYVKHCGGKSIRGEELPTWDDQQRTIQDHWHAAAEAVRLYEMQRNL